MSRSPPWKVYRAGGYVAACWHAEDAACLVALSGGAVKYRHRLIVWREGQEVIEAGESYDRAAEIMHGRKDAHVRQLFESARNKRAA